MAESHLLVSDGHYTAAVRAVIAELLKPDLDMINEGVAAAWPGPDMVFADEFDGPEQQINAAFTAMIQSALKPHQEGNDA
jgi:hypothetical protein